MDFFGLMNKGFVVIETDMLCEPDVFRDSERIYRIVGINESGEMFMLGNLSGPGLGKRDYEELKSIIGDRVMYFENDPDREEYESLLLTSALNGVAIKNESMSISATISDEMLHKYMDEKYFSFHSLEWMREIILSGSYFDGKDTRSVADGSLIAHGDATGLFYDSLKNKHCSCLNLLGEGFALLYDDEEAMRKTRLIISLSDSSQSKRFYLITTDGEGDPACGGLFPILNDPELARLYKEHGLSYFSDWSYKIEDVFSKDIDIKVVKGYLEVIKAEKEKKIDPPFML